MTNKEAVDTIIHFCDYIRPCDEYGYRIMGELVEAHSMACRALRANMWIPVTERLPEDRETVLVYGSKGGIYTAWCSRRYQTVGWHKLNSKSHYCNPTHWMPLPEPPKEENNGKE